MRLVEQAPQQDQVQKIKIVDIVLEQIGKNQEITAVSYTHLTLPTNREV